jgi:hypothetical protein
MASVSTPSSQEEQDWARCLSPRVPTQVEVPEETPKVAISTPIAMVDEPPNSGLGEGPSLTAYIRIPQNPLTIDVSSSDSESILHPTQDPVEDTCPLTPPVLHSPKSSSRTPADPEGQKLSEALRPTGLNPDTEVQELEAISRHLVNQP